MKQFVTVAVILCVCVAGYFVMQKRKVALDNNRAVLMINEERYVEAAALLEDIRRREPRNARALENLGWAYDQMGLLDKARETYIAALAVEPGLPKASMRLEEIDQESGMSQRAAERIERMKSEGWKDDDATLEETLKAAEAQSLLDNVPQAIMLYERALFKNPGNLELEAKIEELQSQKEKGAR